MSDVLAIQGALKARGYDPGPLDGQWGVRSRTATRLFQVASKLLADGVPGTKTLAALGLSKPPARPLWFEVADKLVGTKEAPGVRTNPVILSWAERLGPPVKGVYTADSIPWCGLFVAHCLSTALPDEVLPTTPLWAQSWAKFGVDLKVPAIGAVCVFVRDGGGHVGFYAGEDRGRGVIRLLGGNQSDAVTYASIARSRLVATRWPRTVPLPSAGPVLVQAKGTLSTNEA